MVLEKLAEQLRTGLKILNQASIIDDQTFKKFQNIATTSLFHADVEIARVRDIHAQLKNEWILINRKGFGGTAARHLKMKLFSILMSLVSCPEAVPFEVPSFAKTQKKMQVWLMVGLQGSGKTTTCVKLAHYLQSTKKRKVGLVCADTFRAGAFDQLKQNAVAHKIPFYGTYTETDPVLVASAGVKAFQESKTEIVIVDSAGRHKQESALLEEMKMLAHHLSPDHVFYVMDSSIGQAAKAQVAAFHSAVSIGSIIVTKLDGHSKGGGALSAVSVTKSAISFVGTGEHMKDLQLFDAESFVSRMLGMGDLKGLMTRMKESEAFEKMMENPDTLQVMNFKTIREMLSTSLSLGVMGNMLEYIPGMDTPMKEMFAKSGLSAAEAQTQAQKKTRQMICLIDSMTQQELEWTHSTHRFRTETSRIKRLMRGSGVTDPLVFRSLLELSCTSENVAKASSSNSLLNLRQKSHGNPQSKKQEWNKILDPRMQQMMGGAENLQKMLENMKEMERMANVLKK